MKHEKCIFVPRYGFSRTKNFDVIMQKENLVVQNNWTQSFQIIFRLKGGEEKIKLRWWWNPRGGGGGVL